MNRTVLIALAALVVVAVALVAFRDRLLGSAPALAQGQSQPSGTSGPAPVQSAPAALLDGDRVLGKADAPITILEYASFTCPHCASFNNEVLPKVKAEWIDTGKAKLVYRDFPLDRYALRASIMAECAPPERYFGFVEVLFRQQGKWASDKDPDGELSRIARLGGLGQEQLEQCYADKSREDAVLQERMTGEKTLGVSGTPTIFINGQRVRPTAEDLEQALRRAAGS